MLLLAGLFFGLLLAMLWPGNPASRAVISVTDSIRSTLGGAT
jgi:hypothetical protein